MVKDTCKSEKSAYLDFISKTTILSDLLVRRASTKNVHFDLNPLESY